MIIKVCGMKEPENIREVSGLNIDYMGFIFYPHSKRFVENLDPEFVRSLPNTLKKTGVFVNEEYDKIIDLVMKYKLDAIQLHGDELPEYLISLKRMLSYMNTEYEVEIVKAFGIDEKFDFNSLSAYEELVDFFLFDTKTPEYGGSGKSFDWDVLKNYNGLKPYFLSGGLGEEEVQAIAKYKFRNLYGVDLNSKFEISPGLKDRTKLAKAITSYRELSGTLTNRL